MIRTDLFTASLYFDTATLIHIYTVYMCMYIQLFVHTQQTRNEKEKEKNTHITTPTIKYLAQNNQGEKGEKT